MMRWEVKTFLSNQTSYNFSTCIIKYRTGEIKTDFTEFYSLIYEYKNDCLTASIQYNKDYCSDGELKPTEELFLNFYGAIVTATPLVSDKNEKFF